MAASSPLSALVAVPGSLVLDPTDFTAGSPWGGSLMGLVRDAAWRYMQVWVGVHAEELGVQVEDVLVKEGAALSFALRALDNDALSACFQGSTAAGGTTGHQVLSLGSRGRGTLSSSNARKVAFVPDDADRHDVVYLRRAVPRVMDAPANLHLDGEHLIRVTWVALPDSNGDLAKVGRLADLSA